MSDFFRSDLSNPALRPCPFKNLHGLYKKTSKDYFQELNPPCPRIKIQQSAGRTHNYAISEFEKTVGRGVGAGAALALFIALTEHTPHPPI
jgi:hypothetical protein